MRALRIAAVTAGLMAAGAVFGGVAGILASLALSIREDGILSTLADPGFLLIGGYFGGLFGAVLGPLAAWLLMRHVPLVLAVGGTTVGTVAGAITGLLLGSFELFFYGGFAGFALSALYLRMRIPRHGRALPAGLAPDRLSAGGG